MSSTDIIDIHAHVYPAGSFSEVLKGRNDFKMNVPTPTKPGKEDTILKFTIKGESRATVAPYPFDIDP